MTWARHVARTGQIRNTYKILIGKLEGKGVGVSEMIILKWI